MSCPTCSATMAQLFDSRERTVWHCERCGTVKSLVFGHPDITVPWLVERCRAFESLTEGLGRMATRWHQTWTTLGIAEAINLPENRTAPPNRTPMRE